MLKKQLPIWLEHLTHNQGVHGSAHVGPLLKPFTSNSLGFFILMQPFFLLRVLCLESRKFL